MGKRRFFIYFLFFLWEEMHKNHIRNLSLRSLSVRLSSCYCINGAEALMGGLIWLKHFARLSSFCLSDPSDLCTSFFHITLVVVISPLSCPSPLPLVAFCFIAYFVSSASLFTYRPVPYDLPLLSLPPDLHYPPPASPLPPLLSSLLSNQICNGAHFSEKNLPTP